MPFPVTAFNWDLIQGENVALPFDLVNPDLSPFDLTGYTLYCEFRKEPKKTIQVQAAVALRNVATSGEIELQVTPLQSFAVKEKDEVILYDIYVHNPSEGATRVVEGTITIHPAITRPVAVAGS